MSHVLGVGYTCAGSDRRRIYIELRSTRAFAGEELHQHGREGFRRYGVVLPFQATVLPIGQEAGERLRGVLEESLAFPPLMTSVGIVTEAHCATRSADRGLPCIVSP